MAMINIPGAGKPQIGGGGGASTGIVGPGDTQPNGTQPNIKPLFGNIVNDPNAGKWQTSGSTTKIPTPTPVPRGSPSPLVANTKGTTLNFPAQQKQQSLSTPNGSLVGSAVDNAKATLTTKSPFLGNLSKKI